MTEQRHTVRAMIVALVLCMGTVFAMTSCSSNESKAKALIEEQVKNQGVTDLKMDSFFTDPNIPGKAYTSATVTYNFASSDGKPQREFLGFILAKEGSGWRIERRTGYTTDQQQASKLMAGGK
jgi:hypothetical protein